MTRKLHSDDIKKVIEELKKSEVPYPAIPYRRIVTRKRCQCRLFDKTCWRRAEWEVGTIRYCDQHLRIIFGEI